MSTSRCVTRAAPSGRFDLIDAVGMMMVMKANRRRSLIQLVNTARRTMPQPTRVFRDRRRVEKAQRVRFGEDA